MTRQFILTTKDGHHFVKFHTRIGVEFTDKAELAMRFNSLSEAERVNMASLGGQFVPMRRVGPSRAK